MKRITLTIVLLLVCACCWAQVPPVEADTATSVTVSKLTDNLYAIKLIAGAEFNQPGLEFTVVASAGTDGILLVDAGFVATAERVRDLLDGLGDGKVRMLINTHYHADHIVGNTVLAAGAPILAHRNVVTRLSGNYFNLPGDPDPNRPNVGFGDSLVIHFNGEEIHVVHTPNCHSDGDVYIYFTGSKVVAIGDLIFPDKIPYIDMGAGGTVSGFVAQIQSFVDDFPDDVTFVGTHGRAYSKADMREYLHMLTETTRLVTEAAKAGKTADEITADSVLIDFKKWVGGYLTGTFAFWTRTIVREVVPGTGWGPSICEPLTAILVDGTVSDAVAEYRRLKKTQPDAFDFREAHLNMLGYQLMMRDRADDAMEIFKLNMEMFPESFNVYDSYGEILLAKGDTAQSIVNYEKSVELNPDNANAVTILEKLRK